MSLSLNKNMGEKDNQPTVTYAILLSYPILSYPVQS